MNQSRMWLVVKPTVGIPLFLGGVVIMSLIVHYNVLSHAQWFKDFFIGG